MQNARSKDERSKGDRDDTSLGSRPQPTEDSAGRKVKGSRRRESNVTKAEKSTRKGVRAALNGPTIWRPNQPGTQISGHPPSLVQLAKNELSEQMFEQVSHLLPESHKHLAGKITGMFAEQDITLITQHVGNKEAMIDWINEALEVLGQSARIAREPYTSQSQQPLITTYSSPSFVSTYSTPSTPTSSTSNSTHFTSSYSSHPLPPPPSAPQIHRPSPQRPISVMSTSSCLSCPAVMMPNDYEDVDADSDVHGSPKPQIALLPPDFDSPPPVEQVLHTLSQIHAPEEIRIPIKRRLPSPSVTAQLSMNSQEERRAEEHTEEGCFGVERTGVMDRTDQFMMEEYPMTVLEKINQAVINFMERKLPLMVQDFINHKFAYFCTFVSFLVLLCLVIMSAFARICWVYALGVVLLLAVLVLLQIGGRYLFPDRYTEDLYLARQWFTILGFITLFAHLFWNPASYLVVNFFIGLYTTRNVLFSTFTCLHFYIIANWGILTTPLFIAHLALIQELVFVKKSFRKVYKHPYLSLTKLTPRELEKRKVFDYMRRHQKECDVKEFSDLEADPFYISDATLRMYDDPRYRPYHVEEKKMTKVQDGKKIVSYKEIHHDRDVREKKIVPFSDVRVKHPHFYQALLPLSTIRASNVLVCEELVNETIYLSLTKFGTSPPADGLTSVMRSLMVQIHYYNLPNCPVLLTNSISHGYNRYLTFLKARDSTEHYLQTTSILIGLENASYGKFRHRWYLRNFWLPEDHPFRERLAKFVSMQMVVTLIPIYGYLWRHVPKLLQEKQPTAAVSKLLPMSGNLTVNATNTTQSVGVTSATWIDNITDFLANAKRAIAGYSFLAYAQPLPAVNNYDNVIAGINGRLFVGEKKGVTIGQPKDYALNELRQTVLDDLDRWQPLGDILSKEEWLDLSKNYSQAKKNMLLRLEDTGRYFDTFFLKWESYTGFKAPRIISNSDKKFLTVEGPVIKSIEDQLESLSSTLTGIPVSAWAQTVFDTLSPYEDNEDFQVYVSDISSFESAITPAIKDATENLVFDRLLLNFPLLARKLRSRQQIRHYYKSMGEKIIEYDYDGRASGDARTYAGNTIVNHYLLRNLYTHFDLVPMPYFVSGDDAIFVLPKTIPISEVEHYYANLGFSVELKPTPIATSGFCGFNFENITFRRVCADPITTILKFFMTQFPFKLSKYRSYLSDQALCLLHEYPGDPVLRPAVEWMVQNMPNRTEKYRNWWQMQIMKDGNQWGQILRQAPMSFADYAQLHGNHTELFYQQLADNFLGVVKSICTHPDGYYKMKLESMIAQVDLGTAREVFNEFRILDPYAIEYDIDVGYYYPNLELVQAAALGLVETY